MKWLKSLKTLKRRLTSFKKTLINPQGNENVDLFFYAILYAIRYSLTEKYGPCENDGELKKCHQIGWNF